MIVAAWAADEPTEPVALAHRLASAGDLGRVGGAPYLFDLVDSVPASVMAVHYARLVRDAADPRCAWPRPPRLSTPRTGGSGWPASATSSKRSRAARSAPRESGRGASRWTGRPS